ncbi:hypothetical protein [Mucilaginibacter sp.]|uniref:hypothetical protein n=1 Tax=Mucilaginibacter sp. TaxID=1882438 RepID=UPI00263559C3|nr:hypothetical protein [Mucilaginibacter sp.]MDB4919367.1 hypothetical protein [Mucilaginibacter sp.]
MEHHDLSRPEFYASSAWGTYYPNRYYFTIAVDKTREAAGLSDTKHDLTIAEQRQLQWENYPAILHEFLHYMQDLSTMVGQACLFNQVLMKSIFTKYTTPGMSSAASLGNQKNTSFDNDFYNAFMFNRTLEGGGVLITKMHQISKIENSDEAITARNGSQLVTRMFSIPEIHYVEKTGSGDISASVKLGSFYLFECIAHEIDQLVSKRQNHIMAASNSRKATEYTVGRMVAQFLYPHIEIKNIIRLAVMALQSMNCGDAFIQMVNELKKNESNGISQEQSVLLIKQKIQQQMRQNEANFVALLNEYVRIFQGRTQLEKAFTYLTKVSIELYRERIKDPCFDIEWIYDDKIDELLDKVQLCDFLYIFDHTLPLSLDPGFNRDYIGTALQDMDTSVALKAMVAFDHYFSMHYAQTTVLVEQKIKDNYCCPFYNCCSLHYRKDHANTCQTKPWRIYELQYATDQEYCWYGSGVLETKGLSIPKKMRP